MALSQNGWAAHQSSAQMIPLSWITGRVHPDTVKIFDHLCRRFQAEVEPINPAHSWGWNYRPIRGRVSLSNHASGTAIDLNAPAHPLGKANTFNAAQRAAIRRILTDFGGAITWGGDWTARPDDMHFEVANGTSASALRRVTDALSRPAPTPKPEPIAPPATITIPRRHLGDPMIYRAQNERTKFGVYAHNGGFVELQTKAEYDNLIRTGVKEVWVERRTLDNLIADARGANAPKG